VEEPNLRLPKDKQWGVWEGTPSQGASAMPSLGDKPVKVPQATTSDESSPLAFGLELPAHMTNKVAESTAEKLMHAVEKRARKTKTLVNRGVHGLEREVQRYEGHVAKIAGAREEREKGLQEENVKVQQDNLKRARERAYAAERRATKEKDQEIAVWEENGCDGDRHGKKNKKIVETEADTSVKHAHKWMKGLLEGKSHSPMWGAKLFAPRTEVMSNNAYKKYEKSLKAEKAKTAKAKKTAGVALIEAQKKEVAAHKKAGLTKAKARANKQKKVATAMSKVKNAKKGLAAAVASSPKAQGLSRYLAAPATADTDAN